jgi:hypothetical protein
MPITTVPTSTGFVPSAGDAAPIPSGLLAARPAAADAANTFYRATDGSLAYSDGTNWVAVNAAQIASGAAGSRPAAAAAANTLYRSTDTGTITFSNGTAWLVLGQIEFDAREFGVDPAATDNRVALTNALAAANAVIGTLVLPRGIISYAATGALTVACNLVGQGMDRTILRNTAAGGANSRLTVGTNVPISLRDFTLRSSTTSASPADTNCGLWVAATAGVEISNVRVFNTAGRSVIIAQTPTALQPGLININGCVFSTTEQIGLMEIRGPVRGIRVTRNVFQLPGGTSTDTILVNPTAASGGFASDVKILDNQFVDVSVRGVVVLSGRDIEIAGNHFQSSYGGLIYVGSSVAHSTLVTEDIIIERNSNEGANSTPGDATYAAIDINTATVAKGIDRVRIEKNVLRSCGGTAIRLSGTSSTHPVREPVVVGNTINDTSDPLGNIGTAGALAGIGLSVANARNVKIGDNKFLQIGGRAIDVAATIFGHFYLEPNFFGVGNVSNTANTDMIVFASSASATLIDLKPQVQIGNGNWRFLLNSGNAATAAKMKIHPGWDLEDGTTTTDFGKARFSLGGSSSPFEFTPTVSMPVVSLGGGNYSVTWQNPYFHDVIVQLSPTNGTDTTLQVSISTRGGNTLPIIQGADGFNDVAYGNFVIPARATMVAAFAATSSPGATTDALVAAMWGL